MNRVLKVKFVGKFDVNIYKNFNRFKFRHKEMPGELIVSKFYSINQSFFLLNQNSTYIRDRRASIIIEGKWKER